MSSGIVGMQRVSLYLQAYVRVWDHFMSSEIIGLQHMIESIEREGLTNQRFRCPCATWNLIN